MSTKASLAQRSASAGKVETLTVDYYLNSNTMTIASATPAYLPDRPYLTYLAHWPVK